MVPVDICINLLVCVAWQTAKQAKGAPIKVALMLIIVFIMMIVFQLESRETIRKKTKRMNCAQNQINPGLQLHQWRHEPDHLGPGFSSFFNVATFFFYISTYE